MAQTTAVKVKIEELSKYGFKANDRYVGLSKNLPEADKARLVPGAEFEAEFYIADSGKEYLNKILSAPTGNTPPAVSYPDAAKAKKFTPKYEKKDTVSTSAGLTKDEWAAKDRRISRQGCVQAAVQALAPWHSDVTALFKQAEELADKMLEYVNS